MTVMTEEQKDEVKLDQELVEAMQEHILVEEQLAMETKFLIDSTSKYDHSMERMVAAGIFATTNEGSILQKLAVGAVAATLREYMQSSVRGNGAVYKNFLKDNFEDREEILAFTIIEYLLNTVASKTPKVTSLTISLTNKILDLLSVEQFEKNEPKFFAYLEYEYKTRGLGYINSRKRKLAVKTGNTFGVKETSFKANIGARLIDCVLKSGCNLFTMQNSHTGGKGRVRTLAITEDVFKIMGKVRESNILFGVTYKPLIAPPIPWTSLHDNGGYYAMNSLTFIRNSKSTRYIEANMADMDLSRVYAVINSIQKTKWRVNSYILDVVNSIISQSLVDPSTPTSNPSFFGAIPYMDSLNVYEMVPREKYGPVDEKGYHINTPDYKRWFSDKEVQLKKLEAIRSKRIMFMLAHNIAKEYAEREQMYFTYNTDFRGRLYPIQQILNPQSTGAVKSFLEFAEGKLLTDDGLYWLKIHIANCYGLDKASYDDRIAWVDDNNQMLLDIAKRPLDTLKEWNEADEPLMFLAAAESLLAYSEGREVHVPVSLDATCSGLQLYAGLMKDKQGAEVVNVVDTADMKKPADVYTDVATEVEKYLESGDYPTQFTFTKKDGEKCIATTIIESNDLQGNVTRKLTKRNVMTIPYSVTQRGMYDQVKEILNEMEDNERVFWKGEKWVVAKLLVHLNNKAISKLVEGATEGQRFIKDVIHEYYKDNNDLPLHWKTPFFNFPVVQWKVKNKERKIKSVFGLLTIRNPQNKINKQQQYNGIAPNLVHSLDSTLMYLAVEAMLKKGVTDFMLIHDSFGVPANDVVHLNETVREAFVTLFESNPLEHWVSQINPAQLEEAKDIMINTLDMQDVLKSTYIFS
jgi:DNA-directed RNA polymerase